MRRFAVIPLLVAACESPEPPAACGPIADATVNAGETTTVAACFNDPNGDVLRYSVVSSDPGVATASVSDTTVTVTAVAPGKATITVTASDPGGLKGEQAFSVTVPNRAPVAGDPIPDIEVVVDSAMEVDASKHFSDPDGETLAYSVSSSDSAVATVSVSGSTVTVTALAKGTTGVTVTATDPGGLAATQTFQVTVPNRAPVPGDPIPDIEVVVDSAVEVDASDHFSDPDGDSLAYSATSSDSAVAAVSVSESSESTVRVEALDGGTATVTVTATDPDGLSAQSSFEVTVPNPDRGALEEFYDALDGRNWTENTNWATDAQLGDWHGVTTDGEGRVVRLELSGNGLKGRIPGRIGRLRRLEVFDVHENGSLSGPLPLPLDGLPLDRFHYHATNLCVPADLSFRRWLNGIDDHSGTDVDCLRQLTDTDALDLGPMWSPDGTRIAFTSDRDGSDEIYVMDADGGNQTRLTTDSAPDFAPMWSPDGSEIAFVSVRDGNWDIHVMDADGSNLTRLTTDDAPDFGPRWSPDGTKIAFTSYRDDNDDIYMVDADGSNLTRLTTDADADIVPRWSPDGSEIAYMSDRDGNWDIYVMDADGGSQTRLTTDDADDSQPAWSPDGSEIAFQSDRSGDGWEIYVMDADGDNEERLTYTPDPDNQYPSWSPDGTEIAFDSNHTGDHDIYLMDADGSEVTRLTYSTANDDGTAWSPDGTEIAFASVRVIEGIGNIYVMQVR